MTAAWIDAVASGRGPVDRAVQEQTAEHFADHELVELTLAATATAMLNRYCTALDLPTSAVTLARLAAEVSLICRPKADVSALCAPCDAALSVDWKDEPCPGTPCIASVA